MRLNFYLFILLLSTTAHTQVTFKWLGISGFAISDQATTIVFDPAITRVPIYDYLPFRTIETDKDEVDYWMSRCRLQSIHGTFVNHSHSDHVIDAPYVVKKYGGKLYGSSSVVNIGLGHGLDQTQLQKISVGDSWKVGDFTVHPYSTPHAPHLLNIVLMDGHIEKPLSSPASAWDYLLGDTFSFYITHPKGSILFQSIGRIDEVDPLHELKTDVLLITIANRISSENLIQKRIIPSAAKKLIPLHYDNFFYKMNRGDELDVLWGVNIDEFKQKLKSNVQDATAFWPKYCDEVSLF